MDMVLALCMGIGLSAACGFRVFVPLLITSIAANAGELTLDPAFQWIGTPIALAAFAVATALEIGAYYIPWLDNLLDAIATPAAVVAGTLLTASFLTGMSPFLQWGLAAIAGGVPAGAVQLATTFLRGGSTATTGGLGNPLLSTAEAGASTGLSLLALLLPVVAMVAVVGATVWLIRRLRFRFAPRPSPCAVPVDAGGPA